LHGFYACDTPDDLRIRQGVVRDLPEEATIVDIASLTVVRFAFINLGSLEYRETLSILGFT
jgi:hypothetical protein